MNENWKNKIKIKLEAALADPKSRKKIKLLEVCIIMALVYSVVAALDVPGVIGLILRVICLVGLIIVLFLSIK